MKRDMDLARKIMLELEESPDAIGRTPLRLDLEGHTKEEIGYHVMLLQEAGLLEAMSQHHSGPDGFNWFPKRLTWDGHEFLDASREEGRWEKAKKVVKERTGGLAYGMLRMLLQEWGKEALANVHLPL